MLDLTTVHLLQSLIENRDIKTKNQFDNYGVISKTYNLKTQENESKFT